MLARVRRDYDEEERYDQASDQQVELSNRLLQQYLPKFKLRERIEPLIVRFEDIARKCKWNADWRAIHFINSLSDKLLENNEVPRTLKNIH